jgi:alpha-L-fucosidase 2
MRFGRSSRETPLKTAHFLVFASVGLTLSLGACGDSSPGVRTGGPDSGSVLDGAVSNGSETDANADSTSAAPVGVDGAPSPVVCVFDADAGAPSPSGDAGLPLLPNLATPYQGTFTAPPTQTNTNETTDAPLLGNGDVGVAVLGTIDAMTFILSKTEFWSLSAGTVKAMARLSLSIPGMANASYSMSENIGTGQVTGTFMANGNTISTTSWVQATDTTNNQVITEFTYTGTGSQQVTVSLAPGTDNTYPSSVSSSGDVLYEDVSADSTPTVGGYVTRQVRVATRAVGTTGTVANGQLMFSLSPGQTYVLATSAMSNSDSATYQTQAVSNVESLTTSDVTTLSASHQAWWDAFYRASFVELADKTVEKEYYGSLYLLASTSRTGEAPPGLWGDWILEDPAWNSDYTLNYNYEVPFYAAFPTNHVELADSYDKPVIDWIPNAQAEATANGWTGAYYRVHIGPLPNGSADTSEHNQKSCGAYAATDMIMHYYYAPDPAYASAIYPTLKQMAVFWENYLVADGSNYDIVNDAQQEDDADPETNGVMSLGLVRFLLQASIDISTTLGLDATERAVWQDRLTNLAPFPTYTGCPACTNGETVFRYTEVGRDWDTGNTIGIQHIYPGSQIGLSSDAALLQIANNMVSAMGRWSDGNGTNTFYPAAARVGYDPTMILSNLDSWIQNNTYPNLHIHTGGGGVENLNTVPSTVAEMMLQSFQGVVRVFPNWPSSSDAKFANLRAYGGFLVSSGMSGNAVQYVQIVSEYGGAVTLLNPWQGQTLSVYRNGPSATAVSGSSVTIQTCANDVIIVAPQGTSYASVVSVVSTP